MKIPFSLGGLMEPGLSGRLDGPSRLTIIFACVLPAAAVAMIVMSLIAGVLNIPAKVVAALIALPIGLTVLGLLSVPAAIVSLIVDGFRLRHKTETDRVRRRVLDQEAAAVEAAALKAQAAGIRDALHAVYTQHHEALLEDVRRHLQPDRYGRQDMDGAAAELARFQETVAEPALMLKGYPADLIAAVFQHEQTTLLSPVLVPRS